MNPILENQHYVPDPEARVWEDGRLYIYGSYDLRGADHWCSERYHVFSTSDLVNWQDHGVSLNKDGIDFKNASTFGCS